jgi:GT2 family glycosyltransferase
MLYGADRDPKRLCCAMIVRGTKDTDAFYELFLGRLPENNLVREDKIGRDVFEVAKEFIESEEFEKQVVDCACRDGSLPHRTLPLERLPDVLEVIAGCGLAPANEVATPVDWKGALKQVLTATPCRGIVEARYGKLGQQLIDVLAPAQPAERPAERELQRGAAGEREPLIASGVDIVANTICRGWVIDRNDPRALLHIKIKINGMTARIMPADEFRRDVQDLYGGEGRAGFLVRLDTLPDAAYLVRASVEIVELSQGVVVLPERVIDFSPPVGIEAEIREELMHLRRAINRLEESLPRLLHSQSWALALYGSVRSRLDLVISPPALGTLVGFSVVVIDDPNRPGAAQDTLASVLAQTCEPREILLVVLADSPLGFERGGRVEVVRVEQGEHPNVAVNSIAGRAKGSHLLVLDAGTALATEALAWFAVAIERTSATVIYADQDLVAPDAFGRERLVPLFHPALDRELLLQRNYIGETFCITRSAYIELRGLTIDPSLDARHDLLLRTVARFGRGAVMHLPLVLVCNCSGAPDAEEAQTRTLRTVQAYLERSGVAARAVPHEDAVGRPVPDAVNVIWEGDRTSPISVVIPTRDRADMVFALLSSLHRHTAVWDLVEIVVIVNGALSAPASYAFSEIEHVFGRVKVVFREMPFNWAAINNTAVNECTENGILMFLNDDMVCLTQDWDVRLRSQLTRPEIGVVGGRLLYPNGALQHAGVIFGHNASPAHEAVGDAPSDGLYLDRTLLVHETATVTGAFLACRRAIFDRLGGFDAQRYAVTYSDTDFCVRARARGYSVLYDPFLTWIHYESVSRGRDERDVEKQRRDYLEHKEFRSAFPAIDLVDLGLNPHLARSVRPFETFQRIDREAIETWFQAQRRRRDLLDRTVLHDPSPTRVSIANAASEQ